MEQGSFAKPPHLISYLPDHTCGVTWPCDELHATPIQRYARDDIHVTSDVCDKTAAALEVEHTQAVVPVSNYKQETGVVRRYEQLGGHVHAWSEWTTHQLSSSAMKYEKIMLVPHYTK